MKRTALIPALLAVSLAAPADAHELSGHLAPSGLDFLAEQLPDYVPPHLAPPAMTMDLFTCPGGRVVQLTQRDTELDLAVDAAALSIPERGVVRVELQFDVFADGEAYVLYPYACFGSATCRDQLALIDARATLDFTTAVGADGRPVVTIASIDLGVVEDDIDFTLSECAIDDVANWVIDFGKGWLLDLLVDKLEDVARDKMAPFIEDMIDGFLAFDGTLAITDFDFSVTGIDPRATGLLVTGDADLFSPYGADACVGPDPGEPAPHAGAAPDPSTGAPADLGLALNLGLVDDLLYQVWREGMTCMTADHLAALGLDLDLEDTASLLPGFPPGSQMDIAMRLSTPPRVEGAAGDAATLTLVADGIEVSVGGTAPDGTVTELLVDLDATATATLAIDPSINALTLQIDAVHIARFAVNEEYAAATGFDVVQLQAVAEAALVPALLDELADLPVTGPIFGLFDYYLILRELRTTPSHALVKADLFRKPAVDEVAPNTRIVEAPSGAVRPADAWVRVSATDDLIPPELLRYRFSVDGVAAAPSYLSALRVGAAGESGTYQVEVAAIDLHDNADPTPERAAVTVDGVRPTLRLVGDRIVELESNRDEVSVEWVATDDLTPPEQLVPSVALYRVLDPQNLQDAELIGEAQLAPGSDRATVSVSAGGRYRVVVTVRDGVGNATYTSALVHVAGESAGCGCSQGGADPTDGAPVVLALLSLLAWRRRDPAGAFAHRRRRR